MPTRSISAIIRALRDATWLTPARGRAYGLILLVVTGGLGLAWIGLSRGGLDVRGQPLGTDFSSFWAASALALAGHAASAYDPPVHAMVERAIVGGVDPGGYYAFFYPPLFLLICWPLALLPYGAALAVWLVATGAAYWRVCLAFAGGTRGMTLPILAFPAVFTTIGHGQNAFLATALFGGAVLAHKSRPVLAGALFGLLAFKPHLGLVVPAYLIATGAWRTLFAATGAVLALAVASVLLLGPEVWPAFLKATPLARAALDQGLVGADKMPSVFAAAQLWHSPVSAAYAAQALAALTALGALIHLVRGRRNAAADGPALVTASLLASPFLLDYDLTLLAIPLAWTFAEAQRTGFRPWEKTILLAGFALPLVSRMIAAHLLVPLGPPVIAALFIVVFRRAVAASTAADPRPLAAFSTPALA